MGWKFNYLQSKGTWLFLKASDNITGGDREQREENETHRYS